MLLLDPANEFGGNEVTFAADRMLGRLAKWLRVLGFDVIYGPHLTGYGLIHAARAYGRIILTRDRRLKQKQPPPFLLIASDHYRDQLRQVIEAFHLEISAQVFKRCLRCNSLLEPQSKQAVEAFVPPYVFSTQDSFFRCSRCRKVYWPATHHQRMVTELRELGLG
ncbi:MAG: Mut7-C RNAse domain-containing protein [Candidatus Binatia bacterium]